MIKRDITINLDLTPEELADVFCDMDADQQASFFEHIAIVSDSWTAPFCFQLQSIVDSLGHTDKGRRIMQQLGEYSTDPIV